MNHTISVYRFPSASELVVTPERQNTFGGVSAYGGGATAVTAAAWTNLNESGAVTRSFYGKASAPSTAGDVAIKIASLPVGTYSVTFTGQADTTSAASAETQCSFGITDGTSRPAVTTQSSVGDATTAAQRTTASSFSSIFINTAVQDKTFTVQAYRVAGTGSCTLYADVNRPYLITVTPVDQPSNSALYVQGPVKAAETGAAIPAGYVGETYNNNSSADYFSGLNTYASVTLNPGVWMIFAKASVIDSTGAPSALIQGSCIISTNSAADPVDMSTAWINQGDYFIFGGTSSSVVQMRNPNGSNLTMFSLTSQQTVYLRCRLAYTAGSYSGRGSLRAIRLN